jgi:hypothetical protein
MRSHLQKLHAGEEGPWSPHVSRSVSAPHTASDYILHKDDGTEHSFGKDDDARDSDSKDDDDDGEIALVR